MKTNDNQYYIYLRATKQRISEIEAEGVALAEADGIYENAEANMETIILNFLSGFEDFEIIFL